MTVPAISASVAGGAVAVSFLLAASPAQAEAVVWDANWGATDAPTEIPDANVIDNVPDGTTQLSLQDSSYVADGQTVVRLASTAEGAADVVVIGGAGATGTSTSEGALTLDTWLKVTGGTYEMIVGGNSARNYGGGAAASFTGDSHILLTSEGGQSPTVDYIIGGNYQDGQNAAFTGNTYISVQSGSVLGSIVGAGTAAHFLRVPFTGDSHVWVYTPLSSGADPLFLLPDNYIIGGCATIANDGGNLRQAGSTGVTVDLSAYTAEVGAATPSMDKIIVGDAWLLDQSALTHTVGNSSVSITGTMQDGSNALFPQAVVGASYFMYDGSGSGTGTGFASLTGDVSVTLNGGSFSNVVVGGSYIQSAKGTASSTIDGTTTLTLGGATQVSGADALVVGGSYVNANAATVQSGAITLAINDGSYAADVVGGSYITAAGTGVSTQTTGDISVTVAGGTVSGTLYGGSYCARDTASTNAHGAISVALNGGSILGDVYAAGGLSAESLAPSITAASTQVAVSGSVVLGAEGAPVTISGGVQNANAASSVTGTRTLLLNDTAYSNLAQATFTDFDVVNNAADASLNLQASGTSLTKQGAGELTLLASGSNLDSLSTLVVEAGVLSTGALTQGGTGLSAITVGSGAQLQAAGLTLADNATLSMDVTQETEDGLVAVVDDGSLSVGTGNTLNLTLSGVASLAEGDSRTLLSWDDDSSPFELSQLNWTNASGDDSLVFNFEGSSLVLEHLAADEWVWDGSGGTWSDSTTHWQGSGSSQAGATPNGKELTFKTPTADDATVTIDGTVTPAGVTVSNDVGTSYTFVQGGTGSGISGTGSLSKEDEGTLVISLANAYTGGTVVNGGVLEATVQGALGTGAVTLTSGELLVSEATAVQDNALIFDGGSLHYDADEQRSLDAAAVTRTQGSIPLVEVEEDAEITWQYTEASALQNALGDGLTLEGGGTLVLEAQSTTSDVSLGGAITLDDAGTVLELAAAGAKQLGTQAAPVSITLGEDTTLVVERPQADGESVIYANLSGTGTLQFANSVAAATGTVRLVGENADFEGDIDLGEEGETPAITDSVAVILDFSEGDPLGDTLNLNGLPFATQASGTTASTDADITVAADSTQYALMPGLINTFSGDVDGEADVAWTLDASGITGGQTNVLSGDLSDYEGTLAAKGQQGSVARWQLGAEGASVPDTLSMTLSAEDAYNEFVFNYDSAVSFDGAATGMANITQSGAGTLALTGNNDTVGSLTVEQGCAVTIGSTTDSGLWGNATGTSTLAGPGSITLCYGAFNGMVSVGDVAPAISVDVADGLTFDMGGNEGSLITGSVTLGSGSTLTGVGSDILDRELNFTLAEDNVGAGVAGATAMVQFGTTTVARATSSASLGSETAAITLGASAEAVIALLAEHRVDDVESYLTLTDGSLVTAADFSNVTFSGNLNLLRDLGLRIDRVDGGSLVLSGQAQGVYIAGAGEDPTVVAGYQNFSAYQAVAVMPGETLLLTLDGAPDADAEGEGAIINNLLGAASSNLQVNNTDPSSAAVVILNNTAQSISPTPEGLPGDPAGIDTDFGGSITQLGQDVTFIKTGAGTLSVGGTMSASQLTAQEGTLALNGDGNTLSTLTLDGGAVQLGAGTTTLGTLEDTDDGGRLSIASGATLVTTGNSTLEKAQIGGTDAGAGTLQVAGELTLAEDARLNGVTLNAAEGGTLVLDATSGHTVSALNGAGTVQGNGSADTVGLSVTGTGGSYSGSLTGNGTLTVAEGASQTFAPAFTGSAGWNLTNNGTMTLDFVREDGTNAPLTLGALSLGENSVTTLNLNTASAMDGLLTLSSLTAGQGATLNLSGPRGGDIVTSDGSYIIGTVDGGQTAGLIATLTPDSSNTAYMLLDAARSNISVDDAGNIVLNLVTSSVNTLAPQADNPNSAAAAGMLWNAAYSGLAASGTDIRRVLDALNSGVSRGEANRILSAVSGASTTVLSSAMTADVERQLRAIRNRSTGLGLLPCRSGKEPRSADQRRFGVWVNGEGDHRKLDADGYMPGYSLSSWGGTLGMDASFDGGMKAGLALTALYGDMEARSADHAEGDFDRYYLTAFGRMDVKRWQHTLLGTVGRLDADLDRRVDYGAGSYRTHGSTDGWGYGLMYEIGYTIPMEEDDRFSLQPVANVSWRHIDVDGYTERGSDAGLRVSDQRYNVVTFGAGLRTRAEWGEAFFNRRGLFEARALVKVDAGDRKGEADVALLGSSSWEKVRSRKLKAVGVELGAGFTIPMGEDGGSLFIDGTAELRNAYSNLNGVIGYRFEF